MLSHSPAALAAWARAIFRLFFCCGPAAKGIGGPMTKRKNSSASVASSTDGGGDLAHGAMTGTDYNVE